MKSKILLIFILLMALLLRVVYLSADPINNEFLMTRDEGLYSYAARSMTLFGKWQTDNFNYGRIMPVFPPLQLISVKLLGVHNYSFRIISVFCSLLTIYVVFRFLKKQLNETSAIIGSIILSFNFMYLVFSRSGLPEVTMMLFPLLSFIYWFYAVTEKKKTFINALISGIFFMLAFFTKETMVSLVAVYLLSGCYILFSDRKRGIKLLLGFGLPTISILFFYYFKFYLSNPKEWHENYLATINIHRFRRVFLSWSYLSKQLHDFIFFDYWKYILLLFLILFINLTDSVTKRILPVSCRLASHTPDLRAAGTPSLFVTPIKFTFLWLTIFLFHMFITPAKLGRFMVMSILPVAILVSIAFYQVKAKLKALFYLLLVADITINGLYIYKNIITNQKYTYQTASKELVKIIPKNALSILPVHWVMNDSLKTIMPFLIALNDRSYADFFNKYGHPQYIAILRSQTELYKKKCPVLFSQLQPIKTINDYILYNVVR